MEMDFGAIIVLAVIVIMCLMLVVINKPKQLTYQNMHMESNAVAQPVAQVAQPVAQVAQPVAQPVAPVAQPAAPVAPIVQPVAPKPLTCVGHADCPGHISGGDSLACQDGICVQQMKDWAGVWYIPKDCVGAPFGPRGSCH
jgi:hypothetical protein